MLLFSLNIQNYLQMPLLSCSINIGCSQSLLLNSPPQAHFPLQTRHRIALFPSQGRRTAGTKPLQEHQHPTHCVRLGDRNLEKFQTRGGHGAPQTMGMHLSLGKHPGHDGHPSVPAWMKGKRAFHPNAEPERTH